MCVEVHQPGLESGPECSCCSFSQFRSGLLLRTEGSGDTGKCKQSLLKTTERAGRVQVS